jgi:hypothetical protein
MAENDGSAAIGLSLDINNLKRDITEGGWRRRLEGESIKRCRAQLHIFSRN